MLGLSASERDALIYVTSDLQAANANFAVPRNARKIPDNASSFVVQGESLVIVAIQGCVIGAAAAGFVLNQVFDGVTTKVWQEATQGAGVITFDHYMQRQLTAPLMVYPSFAVKNGAKLSLALIGTPGANSWLQVILAKNEDVRRRGKHQALAVAYDGNSPS